jgi:hypothetical protein
LVRASWPLSRTSKLQIWWPSAGRRSIYSL